MRFREDWVAFGKNEALLNLDKSRESILAVNFGRRRNDDDFPDVLHPFVDDSIVSFVPPKRNGRVDFA